MYSLVGATFLCGVPQGSILGPLVFLYSNDMPNNCQHVIHYRFADDTYLLSEFDNSFSSLNEELTELSSWYAENKLLLNSSKTQLATFNFCNNNNVILDGKVLRNPRMSNS